jgi:biopolymer transport protein TolR
MAFTAANGRTQTALADINITPLVDVVLVLLIIFMVTAPVLAVRHRSQRAHTRTVKEITEERLVISIDKSQRFFSATIPSTSTRSERSQAEDSRSAAPVDLFALRRRCPFGAFATVMDAIKQAGISNVSIVTQPIDSHGGLTDRKMIDICTLTTSIPNTATSPASGLVARPASRVRGLRRALRHLHERHSRHRLGQRRWRRCHGSNLVSAFPCPPIPPDNECAGNGIQGSGEIAAHGSGKEPDAIPIPDKNTKTKIKPAPVKTSATERKPEPEQPESNQIPYGEGGPVSGPYTMSAGGAKGGFGFTGSGGDFGSRSRGTCKPCSARSPKTG